MYLSAMCAPPVWFNGFITTQVQGVNDIHTQLQARLLRQIQKQMFLLLLCTLHTLPNILLILYMYAGMHGPYKLYACHTCTVIYT